MISTHFKNISQIESNWIISPSRGTKYNTYLKPPPRYSLRSSLRLFVFCQYQGTVTTAMPPRTWICEAWVPMSSWFRLFRYSNPPGWMEFCYGYFGTQTYTLLLVWANWTKHVHSWTFSFDFRSSHKVATFVSGSLSMLSLHKSTNSTLCGKHRETCRW